MKSRERAFVHLTFKSFIFGREMTCGMRVMGDPFLRRKTPVKIAVKTETGRATVI